MEDHDRENSERTFAIRVSTSHFTVLVDQQASSKELRLNNFLMDVMYRSASRHQEAKQKKIEFPEMDCGDISDEVSEQVVYWMKNVCINRKQRTWISRDWRNRRRTLIGSSITDWDLQQKLIIGRINRMWFNGTLRSTGARELANQGDQTKMYDLDRSETKQILTQWHLKDTEALSSLEEVFTLECVLK